MTRGSARIAAGGPSAIFSPWSITTILSQRPITNGMWCSMIRKVRPSARRARTVSAIRWRITGWTPASGSSRRRRAGSTARFMASSSSRCWPMERVPARAPACAARPRRASQAVAVASQPAGLGPSPRWPGSRAPAGRGRSSRSGTCGRCRGARSGGSAARRSARRRGRPPRRRGGGAGDQVEDRALPRAVGPDQAHDGPALDLERAAVDGADAAERLRKAADGEPRRRAYFFSHANGGAGTNLPPPVVATAAG